jgi:hypothetical protein
VWQRSHRTSSKGIKGRMSMPNEAIDKAIGYFISAADRPGASRCAVAVGEKSARQT